MNTYKYLFTAVAAALLLSPLDARSCEVKVQDPVFLFSSYTTGTVGAYKEAGFYEPTPIYIESCTKNKFVMIGTGPDSYDSQAFLHVAFDGKLENDFCQIENNTFAKGKRPHDERAAHYQKQTNDFWKCIEITAEDVAGRELFVPTENSGCKITSRTPSRITFEGGRCFIRPSIENRIKITYDVKPNCAKRNFLVEEKISPQDIAFSTNFYLAGNSSGNATDLEQVATATGRFTIEAGPELLNTTDDYGASVPRWPNAWTTEVHLANFSARAFSGSTVFKVNLGVDNRCEYACVGDLCTSPCEFLSPIAGEITLMEYNERRRRWDYLDSWYHGGVSIANWQGFLRGADHFSQLTKLEPGVRYRMKMEFSDPTNDFILLKKRYQQILIDLNRMNLIAGLDRINNLPDLGHLVSLAQLPMLPAVGAIPYVDQTLRSLRSLIDTLKFDYWPPSYESICTTDLRTCLKNPTNKFMVFEQDFTVGDLDSGGYYTTTVTRNEKFSKLGNSYKSTSVNTTPAMRCEIPLDNSAVYTGPPIENQAD